MSEKLPETGSDDITKEAKAEQILEKDVTTEENQEKIEINKEQNEN